MRVTGRRADMPGFSLIEVMIVLVIIGVLLLVAVPGYQESMRKSHRADGMRDLMELVSRKERFYAQNSRYSFDDDDFSTCYVLLATPRGEQTKDACGTLTVNSKGQRDHTGSPDNDGLRCW